jgi:DNA-binding MarR family transcriptional regulator
MSILFMEMSAALMCRPLASSPSRMYRSSASGTICQYSLLVALNRPAQPKMSGHVLALDRATLTAHLKTLRRRGLVDVVPDNTDRRSGRVVLTDKGRDLLGEAVPIWRAAQDEIDSMVVAGDVHGLKADLLAPTFGETSP